MGTFNGSFCRCASSSRAVGFDCRRQTGGGKNNPYPAPYTERRKIVTDTKKILITGATGNVGGAVLNHLATTGVDLRVLAHDEWKAQALRDRGIEDVIVGDFLKPETLGPALQGVSTLFLLTPISP